MEQQHWGEILFPLCLDTEKFAGVVEKAKFPLLGWNAAITNNFYFESWQHFQSLLLSNLHYRIHPLAAKQALEFELPSHCKNSSFVGRRGEFQAVQGLAELWLQPHLGLMSPSPVSPAEVSHTVSPRASHPARCAFSDHDIPGPEFKIQRLKQPGSFQFQNGISPSLNHSKSPVWKKQK